MTTSQTGADAVSPRRAATQRKLREAARKMIADKGFEGATVEDISAQAGFTRGAFYSNYASKDDLALDLLRDYIDGTTRRANEAMQRVALNPPHTLAEAISVGVTEFVRAQPVSLDEVLLVQELQLYTLRHSSFRDLQSQVADQSVHALFTAMSALVTTFGCRFRLSRDETMLLLRGVFDQASVSALDEQRRPDHDLIGRAVTGLLNYLIVCDA